jgi:hypothetical protein
MFISFFFDLTGRSRPAAALNPEPLDLEPQFPGGKPRALDSCPDFIKGSFAGG